jgi:uncharacterized membrane protein
MGKVLSREKVKVLFLITGGACAALGLASAIAGVVIDKMLFMLFIGLVLIMLAVWVFYAVAKGNYQEIKLIEDKPKYSDW